MTSMFARADENNIEPDDSNIPDPDLSGLKIFNDNIVVRTWAPPTELKLKSGVSLHLPVSLKKDVAYLQNVGKVLKVGPLAWKDSNAKPNENPHGFYKCQWAKEGDYVVWPRFVGQRFKYKGVNLTLIKDEQVIFVVDNPGDIDILGTVMETNNE